MRSDLTAAALIRHAAMRLFAERGFASSTVRDIAGAAGVSAGLVLHHYGSKEALRRAVDDHTARLLIGAFEAFMPAADATEPGPIASLVEALEVHPLLLPYLRRRLVDGDATSTQFFRMLFDETAAALARLQSAGILRATPDPEARAAFLLANDLAAVLLRDQLRHVLGDDPLAGAGLERWSSVLLDVYTHGLFTPSGGEAS